MARAILLGGALVWLLAGLVTVAVAVFGADMLAAMLPPLAIDIEALRGAITAMAVALLVGAFLHMGMLVGMGRAWRRAWTAALLLTSVLATLFVALAATAFTSAAAEPMYWLPWLAAGVGATVVAGAYALAAARLVADLRAGSAF